MQKLDMPPTKSSLRRVKEHLAFAYEGFDLLNQKRELLVMELMKHVKTTRNTEERLRAAVLGLYAAYRIAAVDAGSAVVRRKAAATPRRFVLQRRQARFMGIALPVWSCRIKRPRVTANLVGTTAALDRVRSEGMELIATLTAYATAAKAVLLLSRELQKVQRRVNALEKIHIPQNEDTRKYIMDRLEEMEREEVFVKKVIQRRADQR